MISSENKIIKNNINSNSLNGIKSVTFKGLYNNSKILTNNIMLNNENGILVEG